MQYFLKTDSLADEGLNRNTVFAFGCMAKKNPQVM
jgi:hypothetical protein